MPPPDHSDDFLTVAYQLVRPDGGGEEAWKICENARTRSAISRAYYSGFIALKLRVTPHLVKARKEFPAFDAHSRVIKALHRAGHQRLSFRFADLRHLREIADYEWGKPYTHAQATQALAKAAAAKVQVAALSDSALRSIANHL